MRAAIWLLALFAVAAAVALFAGNNQGTITVFWPPWRVDLSLNLVLVILLVAFVLLHAALRALAALFSLPTQARQWRLQQKERTLHAALLDAMVQLIAGRFSRARKAAQAALTQEKTLAALGANLPQAQQVRVLSHLLAAESAQALQDKPARDAHLQQALNESTDRTVLASPETREGVQLRAARWALEDRDAAAALARLEELPQGAQRRTLALRLRLKAARQDRRTLEALETARLLAKHRAFSDAAAQSIVRGLATELLSGAHDPAQLLRAWSELDANEREMPEVAIHAAQRMVALRGDLALARGWLLPAWERMVANPRPGRRAARQAGACARGGARFGRCRLAGPHRKRAAQQPARPEPAVPRGHGLHEAAAVGQGPATADAGRAGLAGHRPLPARLARAGATGRSPRRHGAGRRSVEARGADRLTERRRQGHAGPRALGHAACRTEGLPLPKTSQLMPASIQTPAPP
jgi:HemY protein